MILKICAFKTIMIILEQFKYHQCIKKNLFIEEKEFVKDHEY